MKNRLVAILAAMLATGAVYADDYGYFIFQKTDGTLVSLASESLSMTFSDGKLVATNGTESCTLPLSSLSKMYFSSDDATGIDNVQTADGCGKVEIFSVQGVSLGSFSSLETARKSLASGAYIVKANGRTFKIAVK